MRIQADGEVQMTLAPAKGFDLGDGYGTPVSRRVHGGMEGIIIDTRCRPILFSQDRSEHAERLRQWQQALDSYPETT